MTDGDSLTAVCGSLKVKVHSGQVEVFIAPDIEVTVQAGTVTIVRELSPGLFEVTNEPSSAASVIVDVEEADPIEITVPTDTTIIIGKGPGAPVTVENSSGSKGNAVVKVRGAQTEVLPAATFDLVGLVGYWDFEEGVGSTAADSSGQGNTGSLINADPGTVWTLDAPPTVALNQYALDLDGIDDRVDVGSVLTGQLAEITVAAWVLKRDNGDDRVVCKSTGVTTQAHRFCLGVAGTTITVWIRTTDNGGATSYSGGDIALNEWTHLVFTYDGAKLQILSGAVETATFAVTGNIIASGQPVVLGNVNLIDDRHWNGLIDEVRIYDGALTLGELQSLASIEVTAPPITLPTATPTPAATATPTPAATPTPTATATPTPTAAATPTPTATATPTPTATATPTSTPPPEWEELEDVPEDIRHGGALATDETNIYAFRGGGSRDFFKYDVSAGTWSQLPDAPWNVRQGGALAYLDGYIYAFRRDDEDDFWRFDIEAETWAKRSDAPEEVRWGGALASDGTNTIYALRGDDKEDFWKYDVGDNSWSTLADTPDDVKEGGSLAWAGPDAVYAFRGGEKKEFWSYSVSQDAWSALSDAPQDVQQGGSLAWTGGNFIYALRGDRQDDFWRYDITLNSWESLQDAPDPVGDGGALLFLDDALYALQGDGEEGFMRFRPVGE